MKIPKRISEILKRKQDFIDAQRSKLESSIVKLQGRLLTDIITEVVKELDVKDGIIQDNVKNYKLISQLDKTFRNFQAASSQIMLGQIAGTVSKIGVLSQSYFKLIDLPENLSAKFDKIVSQADRLINLRLGLNEGKLVRGGFLESFFNSNTIGTDLKQMTSKAITSGAAMKDYVNDLRDMITGTPEYKGGLERQFQRYAFDLYQQYDAAYNQLLGNEFGFTYFIYQGGLIVDSRDFCAAHNNKVWSKDEAAEWKEWTPADGNYPQGYEVKAKDMNSVPSYLGYPGYDPLIDRGGYNCRHSLGWISDEMAKELRPDLKESVPLE